MKKIYLLITLILFSNLIQAHGGRTNKEGCHKQNSDHTYHCHNSYSKKNHKNSENTTKNRHKNIIQSQDDKSIKNIFRSETIEKILTLNYEGFTIWLDCQKRAAIKFRYNAQHDTNANFKRKSSFYIDKKVPSYCQQLSTKAYGNGYDRGHLVPANHLDYSKKAIKESNFMINILPQRSTMNRGAWLQTEEITECYRDIDELLIVGGAIWGDKPKNTFKKSHGVDTPNSFYKIILRGDRIIAWIVPNSVYAKRSKLDDYLVSVDDIEKIIKTKIKEVPNYLKNIKLKNSWIIPYGCDKS